MVDCAQIFIDTLAITQSRIVWFRWNLAQIYHVTANTIHTFNVKGSKVKVTGLRRKNVISQERITDRLTDFELGENYPSAESNMW